MELLVDALLVECLVAALDIAGKGVRRSVDDVAVPHLYQSSVSDNPA